MWQPYYKARWIFQTPSLFPTILQPYEELAELTGYPLYGHRNCHHSGILQYGATICTGRSLPRLLPPALAMIARGPP